MTMDMTASARKVNHAPAWIAKGLFSYKRIVLPVRAGRVRLHLQPDTPCVIER